MEQWALPASDDDGADTDREDGNDDGDDYSDGVLAALPLSPHHERPEPSWDAADVALLQHDRLLRSITGADPPDANT